MKNLTTPSSLIPLDALSRDVKRASATLGRDEARFLVDQYYSIQDFRISTSNQVRSILQGNKAIDDVAAKAAEVAPEAEPHETLLFFGEQFKELEKQIKGALDTYSAGQPLGVWAREHMGVGPVIAAGLLAHIDITKSHSASSIWKFAGLAPGQRKQKGVKRDWNAHLKVLCWKLGDSFVKFSGNEKCYYGKLYRQRKAYEIERNDSVQSFSAGTLTEKQAEALIEEQGAVRIGDNLFMGGNSKTAVDTLMTYTFRESETKAAYMAGRLPDGRLDMRARRYAVKRYLVHYFEAAWWLHYGTQPPNPYVQEHMGHVDIEPSPIPYPKP